MKSHILKLKPVMKILSLNKGNCSDCREHSSHLMQSMNIYLIQTCVELVIVLRAKIVAQSFTVDELSNAP